MYLTVKEVAKELQVSTKTIYRKIDSGDLSAVKFGHNTVRISPDAFTKFKKLYDKPANA